MKYLFHGVAMVAAAAAALLGGGCARSGVHAQAVEKPDLVVGAVPVADSAALAHRSRSSRGVPVI